MAVSLADARDYLGIDVTDDNVINKNVTRALATAEKIMLGAVGNDARTYMPNDSRIDELVLIYLADLYSDRGVSAKVSGATRRLVTDMELQLRLELAQAVDTATSGGDA